MATDLNNLDEFVNWDSNDNSNTNAAWDEDADFTQPIPIPESDIDPSLTGMATDLVFANINEDDFSFHALEHFTEQNPMGFMGVNFDPAPLPVEPMLEQEDQPLPLGAPGTTVHTDFWETPDIPCANCALGGFSCKKIREGRFKGYCTSCVALSVECSFGGVIPESLNPGTTTNFPISTLSEDMQPTVFPSESHSNQHSNRSSIADLTALTGADSDDHASQLARQSDAPPPKIGARFSRESVRILKTWLTTHNRHPYPSDEEKEMLQRKTGLNKTQITNWLANARRRGKVQPPRSTSPHVGNLSQGVGSIDIPQRRGTPALESMNPLQRWEHSPPEHEPASVTAIARAVTASSFGVSSGLNSPFSHNYTDDGSSRSVCNQSSASSLGTSHSSNTGSKGSAYSYSSRNSLGSFGSAPFSNRGRRRRRRRAAPKQAGESSKTELHAPLRTFQCTFCTETFRTKHDWQRHEKSLHLSLERWVCAPHGSRAVHPDTGQLCCIFCGEANPGDAHIEAHNHSTCQGRSLEERTFYRKDHLNQHLRLVHNVKFMDWSMKSWKVATPEIRSRCGFCGIVMDTWTIRVDHLAEHFKTGYSMADWKGDWGFDNPVLDMVENSIPPYLIHHERTSPLPYVASHSSPESPRNAYELIKLEMAYFFANYIEQHGGVPTDEDMMVEAARIIFASELLSLQGIAAEVSWLRDVIMVREEIVHRARFAPLRAGTENRLATLKINGKDNLFEQCPMECQLQEFVRAKRLLGLTAMDDELQVEACRIVGRVEEVSTHPSDAVANWLLRLIMSSTHWLADFRRRAHLPRSEDVKDKIIRSTDPTNIDSTIYSYTRLERELADYLKVQRSMGLEPTDEDLQRQARIIIYEFDDGWNQTAADNVFWLAAFKERHPVDGVSPPQDSSPAFSLQKSTNASMTAADTPFTKTSSGPSMQSPYCSMHRARPRPTETDTNLLKASTMFLNDANCYRRLARELRRWVSATMSPLNPSSHVPTDAELQHQARFILYDDDDPWNQTAADNAEWLQRFKRHCGIVKDGGPGLSDGPEWAVEQGGSGFAPPYVFPKSQHEPFSEDVQITLQSGTKPFTAGQSVANSFLQDLKSRYPRPAVIFCSRELELGLIDFVKASVQTTGCLPSTDAVRAEGKRIHKYEPSPMDDSALVDKFQEWMTRKFPNARAPSTATTPFNAAQSVANSFAQDHKSRYPRPPVMFCSKDLELGLIAFVKASVEATGRLPSTDAIRSEGKRIHKYEPSSMDDAALVARFQEWMTRKFPNAESPSAATVQEGESEPFFMPMNLDVNISDEELGNILQDMDFDLHDQQLGQTAEPDGGVSLAMFEE